VVICAIATIYNEGDICGPSIEHLLTLGVDRVYVAHGPSTDDTLDVLHGFGRAVVVVDDPSPVHLQPQRTHELSERATADGAEWVIPFDADEFVYPPNHDTIRDALATVSADVNKLVISCFGHTDWDHRHVKHRDLPKVAWRAGLPIQTTPGNHFVVIDGQEQYDVLWLRELQFRSFEHMQRKVEERCRTLDPALGHSAGGHITRLKGLNDVDLLDAWNMLMSVETVLDPIPLRWR